MRLFQGWWILLLSASICARVEAQSPPVLPHQDRALLAEALRLAAVVRARVWPGWDRTIPRILLVGDSTEFLIGHSEAPAGFTGTGYDTLLKQHVWLRPRRFPSTLLATFPAVDGRPTIVIGSAARTGKSPTAWVLALLHEHFHQWQYSRPDYFTGVSRLGLAGADTTGQWMLDYPFPYDDPAIGKAAGRLAMALSRALEAPSGTGDEAMPAVASASEALLRSLAAPDRRYLEFQLWQEGVARFIEYASARVISEAGGSSDESYAAIARSSRQDLSLELAQLDLRADRRLAFYPLGAAIAMLLEEVRPDWKRAYGERPFQLAALLSPP